MPLKDLRIDLYMRNAPIFAHTNDRILRAFWTCQYVHWRSPQSSVHSLKTSLGKVKHVHSMCYLHISLLHVWFFEKRKNHTRDWSYIVHWSLVSCVPFYTKHNLTHVWDPCKVVFPCLNHYALLRLFGKSYKTRELQCQCLCDIV